MWPLAWRAANGESPTPPFQPAAPCGVRTTGTSIREGALTLTLMVFCPGMLLTDAPIASNCRWTAPMSPDSSAAVRACAAAAPLACETCAMSDSIADHSSLAFPPAVWNAPITALKSGASIGCLLPQMLLRMSIALSMSPASSACENAPAASRPLAPATWVTRSRPEAISVFDASAPALAAFVMSVTATAP